MSTKKAEFYADSKSEAKIEKKHTNKKFFLKLAKTQFFNNFLAGLRIRSIFGRIRIQQIRILKPDPDPTGTYQESIQASKFFSHQTYFFWYLNDDYFYLNKWKNSPENV